MDQNPTRQKKAWSLSERWVGVLVFSFLILTILAGYLAFSSVADAVASLKTKIAPPDILEPPQIPTQVEKYLDISSPLQSGNGPPGGPWDGKSRITILLLGVDNRDWEAGNGPPRTDTIILATMDPQQRTAGMLSIPRDLWVEIPGYGYNKINQAYRFGEANQEPEGGAGLAIDTVEKLFDIEIPYYALIDFDTFVTLVDEIGGVKIYVPEEIRIDPLGEKNPTTLQPGIQALPGDLALAYVRQRDTAGSDFDRAQRQHQVILGIQSRLTSFRLIPALIEKAPILYNEIASGLQTNLNLRQSVQFSWQTTQIPPQNIYDEIIGPDQVVFATSWDGMSILQPLPEEIMKMRDALFAIQPPESPASVLEMSPDERVVAENAEIGLRNGTYTAGLAAHTGNYLEEMNFNIVSINNADQYYAQTTLIDFAGKPYTIALLAEILNVSPGKIYQRFDPNNEVEVLVILGEDWATSGEMP